MGDQGGRGVEVTGSRCRCLCGRVGGWEQEWQWWQWLRVPHGLGVCEQRAERLHGG